MALKNDERKFETECTASVILSSPYSLRSSSRFHDFSFSVSQTQSFYGTRSFLRFSIVDEKIKWRVKYLRPKRKCECEQWIPAQDDDLKSSVQYSIVNTVEGKRFNVVWVPQALRWEVTSTSFFVRAKKIYTDLFIQTLSTFIV